MQEAARRPAMTIDAAELPSHVGIELGPSRPVLIDQPLIDAFAKITGDEHWIHTDVERTRRELPGGVPLAHGYLLLALITGLMNDLLEVRFERALNYGLNRVRFTRPVGAGSRVRLFVKLQEALPLEAGAIRLTSACRMAIDGDERPAFVAETISIFYP